MAAVLSRHNFRAIRALLLATIGVLWFAGCNSEGIHPVKGRVIWKDTRQPASELADSLISFEQADSQTSARGQIKPDGTFQLTTNQENDGAKLGEHVVLIVEIGRKSLGGPDATRLAPGKIATRYSTAASDLRAVVKPGLNEPEIEVERFDGK